DPEFVSQLPLLFDASASGFQHYCLMMRDKNGGRRVNLVPGLPPQDIYQMVADRLSDPLFVVRWEEVRPGVKIAVHVDARIYAFLATHPNLRGMVKAVLVPRMYGGKDIGATLLLEGWFIPPAVSRSASGYRREAAKARQKEQRKRLAKTARAC